MSTTAFGQEHGYNWYFGQFAGITFTQGEPIPSLNGQVSFGTNNYSEGSSAISNGEGQLLLYTNGETIWNKFHEVMENGTGLLGNWSSTQSSLIIPEPESDTRFYVFTTDGFVNDLENGFRYSIADICLAQDSGAVLSGHKNILLLDSVAEKLAAVKHSNEVDYWVVVHKYWSDAFHSFLLTENGIADEVISNVGYTIEHSSNGGTGASIGQMKISPNGERLAVCLSNRNPTLFEIFDFNASTGVVSNPIQVSTDTLGTTYGIEFSPDNSRLYLGASIDGLFQIDLLAGDSSAISNSFQPIVSPTNFSLFGLQIGPNGKIYVANWGDTTLGVINDPNNLGAACNYVESQVFLNGRECSYSLPNFVAGFDYHNEVVDCSTTISEIPEADSPVIYPNPSIDRNFLSIENLPVGNYWFQLFDLNGREILQQPVLNQTAAKIDIQHLDHGTYIYVIRTDNHIVDRGKALIKNTEPNNR